MIKFRNRESLKETVQFLKNYWIITEDDKSVHELYSILIYLTAKEEVDNSSFPFLLIKSESPDFRFMDIDENIFLGVEHTIATVKDYKMASAEFSKLPIGSKLELDYYTPFNKLEKKEVFKGILKPDERLKSQSYIGDRPEAEWAEIINKSINDKTDLLNKKKFDKYIRNELLIDDDTPVEGIIDLEIALEKLLTKKEAYNAQDNIIKYDRINILSKKYLVFDVFNQCAIIDKSKENLTRLYLS